MAMTGETKSQNFHNVITTCVQSNTPLLNPIKLSTVANYDSRVVAAN